MPITHMQHYMVLSELMPHKRIDVAIQAFNKLGLPLVVCGDGPEARALRRIAGPTVQFVGRASDPEAARLLNSSRALVVSAVEEFGIGFPPRITSMMFRGTRYSLNWIPLGGFVRMLGEDGDVEIRRLRDVPI